MLSFNICLRELEIKVRFLDCIFVAMSMHAQITAGRCTYPFQDGVRNESPS